MFPGLLIALAAQAAAATPTDIVEPDPKAMSRSEIRQFNAKLAKTHPFYIRCVRSAEVGSLVKRNYSCRTNAQWDRADRIGNQNAYETYDTFKPRGNPGGPGS